MNQNMSKSRKNLAAVIHVAAALAATSEQVPSAAPETTSNVEASEQSATVETAPNVETAAQVEAPTSSDIPAPAPTAEQVSVLTSSGILSDEKIGEIQGALRTLHANLYSFGKVPVPATFEACAALDIEAITKKALRALTAWNGAQIEKTLGAFRAPIDAIGETYMSQARDLRAQYDAAPPALRPFITLPENVSVPVSAMVGEGKPFASLEAANKTLIQLGYKVSNRKSGTYMLLPFPASAPATVAATNA
jgi:hypothetical protein